MRLTFRIIPCNLQVACFTAFSYDSSEKLYFRFIAEHGSNIWSKDAKEIKTAVHSFLTVKIK